MTRSHSFSRPVAIALLLAVATLSGAVVADDQDESSPFDGCEPLDGTVYLCDADLEDGQAVFELIATEDTTVGVGDSSVFLEGGQVTIDERQLEGEQPVTVRHDVDEADGFYGAFIVTEQNYFHPEVFEDRSTMLPGEPSVTDIWVSVATTVAIVVVSMPIAYLGVRRMRGVIRRVF